MAAEAGRCLAILFRSPVAAAQSTPAHLRIALSAHEGRLLVTLPKRRGPPLTRPVALSLRPQPVRRASPPTLVALATARHARVASA
jgi:cell division inhibitor SulA/protein ImuA